MTYHIEDNKKTRLSQDYKYFNVCYTIFVAAYRCVDCYENRKVHIVNNKGEKINFKNHEKYVETVKLAKDTSVKKSSTKKVKPSMQKSGLKVASPAVKATSGVPEKDRTRGYIEGRKATVKPMKAKYAKVYNHQY